MACVKSSRAEENAAVCAAILAAEDHYDVLQVPGGAKTDEIRRNYLRISVRVHPDRNQDPNATQAFQKVSEAYAVLSDEEARRKYDAEQFMSSAGERGVERGGSGRCRPAAAATARRVGTPRPRPGAARLPGGDRRGACGHGRGRRRARISRARGGVDTARAR